VAQLFVLSLMLNQAGAVVHAARIQHVICPVHGDLVDDSDAHESKTPDKNAPHEHSDHCSIMHALHQPMTLTVTPGVGLPAPPVEIPNVAWLSFDALSIELCHLAPKTSPPV
jgi:hypothetical protein